MMPRSRQNKGSKTAERQRQYTFMLLHFKTSTQLANIVQQKSETRTTEQGAMKPCATALWRSVLLRTLWHIVRIQTEHKSLYVIGRLQYLYGCSENHFKKEVKIWKIIYTIQTRSLHITIHCILKGR